LTTDGILPGLDFQIIDEIMNVLLPAYWPFDFAALRPFLYVGFFQP
jgi:hypothetical protein